jgi:hypothetical protein
VTANPSFVGTLTEPFGVFNGLEYVRHRGRFEGVTSRGAFRVPFEIVAPVDPVAGARTLLIEPPHFAFGSVGRELTLGRAFLFNQGIRYAAVGFGLNGRNILEPLAGDVIIAGDPAARSNSASRKQTFRC